MSKFGWVVVKDAHFMKEAAPVTRFVEWNQCPTNVIWLYMVTWWPDVCWNVAVANRSHWWWYIISFAPFGTNSNRFLLSHSMRMLNSWNRQLFLFFSAPTVESYQYESLLSFNTFSWTIVSWNITKALNKMVDLVRIYYEKKKIPKKYGSGKKCVINAMTVELPFNRFLNPRKTGSFFIRENAIIIFHIFAISFLSKFLKIFVQITFLWKKK